MPILTQSQRRALRAAIQALDAAYDCLRPASEASFDDRLSVAAQCEDAIALGERNLWILCEEE